ncbi:MAG: hypothetical protein IJL30_09645 [Clostridia bacterium]|nr:hypothetical protein [Clostridia bacterium]
MKTVRSAGVIKTALVFLLLISVILSLSSCGKYVSHYKAVGFVHSNEPSSAFMNFYSFDGSMVFVMNKKESERLDYSAKLETGSLKVYYDKDGEKTELFSLSDGGSAESSFEGINDGTVYIIVETDGTCFNGELNFNIGG